MEYQKLRRIGLLSDSHGDAEITRRAVERLVEAGVEVLVHLGDINSSGVIDALAVRLGERGELQPPVHLVFGNTDWNREELAAYARELGMHVDHPSGRLVLDGKVLAYQHGHRKALMDEALADRVHYLCHGHTHLTRDERSDGTRLINPGALHRARDYTVAILDVAEDRLEFISIEPRRR